MPKRQSIPSSLIGRLPAASSGGIELSFPVAIASKIPARNASLRPGLEADDATSCSRACQAGDHGNLHQLGGSTRRAGRVPGNIHSFTNNLSEYPMLNSQSAIAASGVTAARDRPRALHHAIGTTFSPNN